MKMKRLLLVSAAALAAASIVSGVRADLNCVATNVVGGCGQGVTTLGTNTWTGTNNFQDSTFSIFDDGDQTKKVQVQASGITTGNTIVPFAFRGTAAAPSIGIPAGTAAEPAIQFTTDADGSGTGIYRSSANFITFSSNGVPQALIRTASAGNAAFSIGQFSIGGNASIGGADDAFLGRRLAALVWGTTDTTGANPTWIQQTPARSMLAADYTNATTTFSNTALSFTVTTGRKYTFTGSLQVVDSTAADGIKIDFNGGAATATNFVASCVLTSDTGTIVTQANATTAALATTINAAAMATTNVHLYACSGSFEPSSTNTFILRGAQNAHSTGTLTIKRGSWIWLEDTP